MAILNGFTLALIMFIHSFEVFDINHLERFTSDMSEIKKQINYSRLDNVECAKGSYPPPPGRNISTYIIDLDLPPDQRWAKLSKKYKSNIIDMMEVLKNITKPIFHGIIVELVDIYIPRLIESLPYPYNEEIKGIATATGLELGEIGLYNCFYEFATYCTSILAQSNGELYHARNLDFGLLLGWDKENKTWKMTEILRELTVEMEFQREGKTVFQSVGFVGYVGVITGMKPYGFSITLNERFQFMGAYLGLLKWLFGSRSGSWIGFLIRDTLEHENYYDKAKEKLIAAKLISPAYIIIGGNQTGQGAIITRSFTTADVWNIGKGDSEWYLLETNYDHWRNPPVYDDRRGPAKKCMNQMGEKNLSISGLFDVLSTIPVLNKLTVHTTIMNVRKGESTSYRQYCVSNDCPLF